MKFIYCLNLLLASAVLVSCHSDAPAVKSMAADTVPVQVVLLLQQKGNASTSVSGQLTTEDEVLLSFKTGGIIDRVLVKEGDAVRKGQLLATLNLTEINTQVQQAQLALDKANRDYKRTNNLYTDSVATLEQLQNARTALQLAQKQVELVSFNRKFSEIHAPSDGFILKKMADAGQQVASGAAILQTNGSGKWMLKAGVSDQDWALLRTGDPAKLEIASRPGQFFDGRLSRKSEGADAATGTFTVYLDFTGDKPSNMAAGMFGKASIRSAAPIVSGWRIPYEALLDGDGTTGYVFITNDNKTAQRKAVRVGTIEKNTVIITDGLQDSKALIVSGSAYLRDNSRISIHSPSKPVQ